jgi:signal transduction histidine kinase
VVALTLQEGILTLYYKDDGCGFNAKEMMSAGMGLPNITSRINSLNGDLQITSKQGDGMRVMAHIDTQHGDIKNNKTRKKERWKEI